MRLVEEEDGDPNATSAVAEVALKLRAGDIDFEIEDEEGTCSHQQPHCYHATLPSHNLARKKSRVYLVEGRPLVLISGTWASPNYHFRPPCSHSPGGHKYKRGPAAHTHAMHAMHVPHSLHALHAPHQKQALQL